MATTLPDAILQRLRASSVAGLVGDTFDPDTGLGTVRIGFDYLGNGALPYVVIQEPGESRTYFTGGGFGGSTFIADGTLAVEGYSASRDGARTLAKAIAEALNDADLTWTDGRMMNLRAMSTAFTPIADVGTGSPTAFASVLTLAFTYQGDV